MRAKNGTKEEIIKHIERFFLKLPEVIKANTDKIHESHVNLFKNKNLI